MPNRDFLKYIGFTTAAAIAVSKIKTMEQSNTPTIDDMNEAIAQFDGWELVERELPLSEYNFHIVMCFEKNGRRKFHSDLKYHKSWKALMPVVEKISKIRLLNALGNVSTDPQDVCFLRTFGMPTEDGKQVMVRFTGWGIHTADTLIEAAHMACYEIAKSELVNQQTTINGS